MQKGHILEFNCITCQTPVQFSLFYLDNDEPLTCLRCDKQYLLQDETLQRQLRKFEALCCQIRESEEILGNTVVAINVGKHEVAVPYKLLLTRLSSQLNLKFGNEEIAIAFRFEPAQDTPRSATTAATEEHETSWGSSKEMCKNKLPDCSSASTLDARRIFAAETNLSARICNAAEKVLDEFQSDNLFLHTS